MLKKICGLFLGLVVLTGSACVTPTHASSAFGIVLTHIQASGVSGAKEEMVALYNNSPNEITITDWCIQNKANVSFACFTPPTSTYNYVLPAYSSALVATEPFLATHSLELEAISAVYLVTNQSSGSIVNSSDTVSLINQEGEIVDAHSWSTAIPSGKILNRLKSISVPTMYETLDPSIDWANNVLTYIPLNQMEMVEKAMNQPDEDPDPLPGEEPDTPDPDTDPEDNPSSESIHPLISELLPDAEGSDTGNEFIELYNPTNAEVSLADYKLRVGPSLEKTYSFPVGSLLPALGYMAISNNQVGFSLLNSASSVQLEYAGQLIGNTVTYSSPPAGESWAYIDSVWQYTSVLTPGALNIASSYISDTETEVTETSLKPCAENQYRSLQTNRCRLISTAASTSTVTPCKPGQVRNLETNRCRNITTATSPTPCKEGQERNPETNRCRNVTKMTESGHGVKGVATQQTGTAWYAWLGIGGIILVILSYGVWEWRDELKALGIALRQKVARNKP